MDNVMTEAPQKGDILWGCKSIAREIGQSERQTFYMLEKGMIPARKIGEKWCASKQLLRRHLIGDAA